MWDVLALSIVVQAVVAFLPGAIALFALRFDAPVALSCAPILAVAGATALTIVYRACGIACSWENILLPLFGIALVVAAAAVLARRMRAASIGADGAHAASGDQAGAGSRKKAAGRKARARSARAARLAAAVCAGLAAGIFVFLGSIEGADAYIQEYDNVHHLGQISAYVETGNWSPWDATMYPGEDAALDSDAGSSFYPSVWHLFAAIAASALGASVPVAANASTFLFGFVVYPVAMWAFLEKVFAGKPAVVVLGSCAAVAFGSFPYGFVTFGPLYPNLVSFALVPAAGAAFVALFDPEASLARRVGYAALFACGLAALVFAQPNGVFSLGVLMLFFCALQTARAGGRWWTRRRARRAAEGARTAGDAGGDRACSAVPGDRAGALSAASAPDPHERRRLAGVKFGFAVGFLILAAMLWIALYYSPPLRSVVTHFWPSHATVPQSILDVLFAAYDQFAPSILLGALVLVGAVYTLYRREFVWITCSYVFMSGIYFVCSVSNGFVKSLTSGFWYTDSVRLSATLVIIAVPLAALGLYVVYRGARAGLSAIARRMGTGFSYARFALPVVAAVFFAAALWPSFSVSWNDPVVTQMGSVAQKTATLYGAEDHKIYDDAEQAFVERAIEALPEGALVLNEPNDGSAFAYCADGLNVAYRYMRDFDTEDETAESRAIRLGLANVASDASVADAVHSMGAEYLIQLDQGDFNQEQRYLFTYEPEKWTGIDAVNDDTPGFEVVLSEGDMRLYRIVA